MLSRDSKNSTLNMLITDAIGAEIEYVTISSTRTLPIETQERLHEWLSMPEIETLYRTFMAHPRKKLDYTELRDLLQTVEVSFTDSEYNRLFLKINQNRDFLVDWNEFISYLIFGFQEDDPSNKKESLILPISSPPVVHKTEHRSSVCCIALLKPVSDQTPLDEDMSKRNQFNSTVDDSAEANGMWLTASREGQLRFWTPHLEPIRSCTSESLYLKMPTWILAVQALSDVSVVCTSSTERELRFHETIASTFTLRIVIRNLPYAVYCMNYSFYTNGEVDSRLILGDYAGNVRVLSFSPYLRGPFQSKPGAALLEVFWNDVLKGKIPHLKVREYNHLHKEMISSVYYSLRMKMTFAAAEYRNTKKYRGRCPGLVLVGNDEKVTFRIPLGVTTFFVDEVHNIVVTGGPDTYVRVWDVYVQSEPSGILTGHNGGIVMVFVQAEENKVYSVDYQKIIKVWDLTEHTLLQTYGDLVQLIRGSETDLTYFYHPHLRELLVGGRKLLSIKCCPRVRADLTDGNTHAAPVSVVLYNRLFRNIVTCGLDSYIIVWDPWTGRRKIIMKSCHTKMVYGETIDIEITAACFDPLEQFLLTGARDGSLKIWNYNNSVCVRHMSITPECEVTAVIWVVDRILAVGWDRQVTEFNDVEGREYSDPKHWPGYHTDDITCAAVKLGEGVVTATYSGELVFWKLETGQPYRRYSVMNPTLFIELKLGKQGDLSNTSKKTQLMTRYTIENTNETMRSLSGRSTKISTFGETCQPPQPKKSHSLPISVQAVIFLQTRPMTKEHGSVLVALNNGTIQAYSHHQRGSYLKEFNSVHKTGDCVLTMATDRKNRYLFTGTAFGYIKIWYIKNYCVPEEEKQNICMPKMRLQFIFLRKERFLTQAKRVIRFQPEPLLLSSYKGHLKAINSISFINLPKIVLSGGHDFSCRLWSLGGRYLGTLGTILPWTRLSPFEIAGFEERPFRLPPDIRKVASSTTMKVISGVQAFPISLSPYSKLKDKEDKDEKEDEIIDDDESKTTFDKALREPILGKHFSLPGKSATMQMIELDTSQSYIPVYLHLRVHESEGIERSKTPPIVKQIETQNYLNYYTPQKGHINYKTSALNIKVWKKTPKIRKTPRNTSVGSDKVADTHRLKAGLVEQLSSALEETESLSLKSNKESADDELKLPIDSGREKQNQMTARKPTLKAQKKSIGHDPTASNLESILPSTNSGSNETQSLKNSSLSFKCNLPEIVTQVPTLYGLKPAFIAKKPFILNDAKAVIEEVKTMREKQLAIDAVEPLTDRLKPAFKRKKPYTDRYPSINTKSNFDRKKLALSGLRSVGWNAGGAAVNCKSVLQGYGNIKSTYNGRGVFTHQRTLTTDSSKSEKKIRTERSSVFSRQSPILNFCEVRRALRTLSDRAKQ